MCIYVFPLPEDKDSSNPFPQKQNHASIQIDSIREIWFTMFIHTCLTLKEGILYKYMVIKTRCIFHNVTQFQ